MLTRLCSGLELSPILGWNEDPASHSAPPLHTEQLSLPPAVISRKPIQVAGTSSTSLPNDHNSFYTRFEKKFEKNSTQLESFISTLRPDDFQDLSQGSLTAAQCDLEKLNSDSHPKEEHRQGPE
ncbi:uncharacterized protein AB9W97_016138 isoform 2-T2 [Spinachia spinachia]